jgi:hypothetical protein
MNIKPDGSERDQPHCQGSIISFSTNWHEAPTPRTCLAHLRSMKSRILEMLVKQWVPLMSVWNSSWNRSQRSSGTA